MASIESILQVIVDHPGLTANEIASEVELAASDVQSRLVKHIESGKVKKDLKPMEGGRSVFAYFPGQSLISEVDGVKRVITQARAPRASASTEPGPREFTFGFFSDGSLSVQKGTKEMRMSRAETAQLLEFLDCINVEKIAGV